MPVKPLFKGLGSLLGEIRLDSILANPDTSTSQENLTTLTSYNLMPKDMRTIVVPGSPSIWNPQNLPATIKPDSGPYFTDPSRHVFPHCLLEPLLRALLVAHPNYNLSDIDLITDRRNLRLLLDFVSGNQKEFRIEVEVVGSTVLFSTWTERAKDYVKGFVGYGREFERAWTRTPAGLEGSMMHNRVVGYSLGGLKVVMRFEVDGCMEEHDAPNQHCTDSSTVITPIDDPKHPHTKLTTPTYFTILTHGTLAPASNIIEIKTGSLKKNLVSLRNLGQLWFSQTPILCIGQYGAGGVFSEVSVKNVLLAGELSRWEEHNRENLKKLVRVLEMIREVVRKEGGKCVLVLPQGGKTLGVYKRGGEQGGKGKATGMGMVVGVPPDLVERWGNRVAD
ncbi:hypothetical protein FGG08_003719 [Glutinoglossum americanum]|uniref:Uncharacterized protein n=1 Tax=Glutinoglossum americanum TaxID=1670608 RepID=A0A9P8I6Q2_9PEZI|nr:hypothetical protein FGG08_003719 [Glutinoglossum americanum]